MLHCVEYLLPQNVKSALLQDALITSGAVKHAMQCEWCSRMKKEQPTMHCRYITHLHIYTLINRTKGQSLKSQAEENIKMTQCAKFVRTRHYELKSSNWKWQRHTKHQSRLTFHSFIRMGWEISESSTPSRPRTRTHTRSNQSSPRWALSQSTELLQGDGGHVFLFNQTHFHR